MVYYSLEPFGEAQSEYRAALVASTIANTARDDKAHPQAFQADEFMRPGYLVQTAEATDPDQALMNKALAIFSMFGPIQKE